MSEDKPKENETKKVKDSEHPDEDPDPDKFSTAIGSVLSSTLLMGDDGQPILDSTTANFVGVYYNNLAEGPKNPQIIEEQEKEDSFLEDSIYPNNQELYFQRKKEKEKRTEDLNLTRMRVDLVVANSKLAVKTKECSEKNS